MNRRVFTVIGILVTVVSLYLAFRGIHLPEVWAAMKGAGYWWALPVVGSTLLSVWIRAVRWKVLLEPVKPVTVSQSYRATMIGFMANNVLPLRLGEVVRAYAIGRAAGVSKSSAFATIVVERAFDLLALLLFLAVMLLKYSFAGWVQVAGYVSAGIFVGMVAIMVLLRAKRDATLAVLGYVFRRLPSGVEEKAHDLVHRFLDGLEVLARGHHLFVITVLSVLTWLALAAGFYFTGLAFDLAIPVDASIVLVVVCSLAVMLPSGPGFVGTFELGARSGLELFKVPEDVALSFALFNHGVQFVFFTALGFYYLWRENFSLKRAVEDQPDEGEEG